MDDLTPEALAAFIDGLGQAAYDIGLADELAFILVRASENTLRETARRERGNNVVAFKRPEEG